MKNAHLVDGEDKTTFFPFILEEVYGSGGIDYRLVFADWEWLHNRLGTDTICGYYLNGTGVEGLIKAARIEHCLSLAEDRINYNSEGDTCYLQFSSLEDASVTAELAQRLLIDKAHMEAAIARARAEDLEE